MTTPLGLKIEGNLMARVGFYQGALHCEGETLADHLASDEINANKFID
jgi:hypothetical protein